MKKILLGLFSFGFLACTDYEADFEKIYAPQVAAWQEQQVLLQQYIESQSNGNGLPVDNGKMDSGVECAEGGVVDFSDQYFDYHFLCQAGHWMLISSTPKSVPVTPNPVVTPSSSSKAKSSSSKAKTSTVTHSCPLAMYCPGSKKNTPSYTGQVETGFNDGTGEYGFWYTYTDEVDGGNSYFEWPAGFDSYGSFETPSRDTYGALKGSFVMSRVYVYPYGGLAFNIGGSLQKGYNIAGWGGMCVTYTSTMSILVEIKPENEGKVTDYDNPVGLLKPAATKTTVDLPWNKFDQQGWGKVRVATSTVVADAATIALKFQSGTDFEIYAIGILGTCN